MPDLRLWFPAAAEIAAQAIDDNAAKRSFLADPTSFLVKYKINALLNATSRELSRLAFGGSVDDDAASSRLRSNCQRADREPEGSAFQAWNRVPPSKRKNDARVVETDPAALERANEQHYFLEQRVSELCKSRDLTPRTNIHVDLVVDCEDKSVVFEMKSCRPGRVRNQLRRAIRQLLEYSYIYRTQLKARVFLCAVLVAQARRASRLAGRLR